MGKYNVNQQLYALGKYMSAYEAIQEGLGKRVEIRILAQRAQEGSVELSRFSAEIKNLANLDHPAILRVLDCGVANGKLYYVVELKRRLTVQEWVAQTPPPPLEERLKVAVQIAAGLKYMHGKGIIHRGVDEIAVNYDPEVQQAYISQFSFVKNVRTDNLTSRGIGNVFQLLTTPEGAMGQSLDARSDVFLLGVLAFKMIAGQEPYSSKAFLGLTVETAANVQQKRVKEVDPQALEVLDKCLAKACAVLPGDPGASTMYVAAPIVRDGRIAGVLSVGKPTRNVNALTAGTRRRVAVTGTAVGLVVIGACLWFARRAVQPLAALTAHARAVRDGRPAFLPPLDVEEMRVMGAAFEEMRDALEGKRTVETYVETLTHELKSPLASIRGAAELLGEDLPAERRRAFLSNITGEVDRLTSLVDRLLLLSSLEARKGQLDSGPLDVPALVGEVAASLRTAALARGIAIGIEVHGDGRTTGERFLVRQAVQNLLANAIDFSPDGGRIEVVVADEGRRVKITVADTGPGVPAYALGRVFDRFYSLERPLTGKKSSGLGLSLVAEVARMHGGGATLANRAPTGAEAAFWIPRV